MANKYDLFEAYYVDIRSAVEEYTEEALRSRGKVQYTIGIYDDGEVVVDEQEIGRKPVSHGGDDREYFFLTVVSSQYMFDEDGEIDIDQMDDDASYDDDDMDDPEQYNNFDDEDDIIDDLLARINWDDKMAEIEDAFYYEE